MTIEQIGLLHVAHVPGVRDDRTLCTGNRRMKLLRDVQRTATIMVDVPEAET